MAAGSLSGKAVIVTGAGGGIGREICRVLAARGAKIVASDFDEGRAEEAASARRWSSTTSFPGPTEGATLPLDALMP